MTVDIRISVGGTADQGRELQGIAGWLQDDEAFARHWQFVAQPAPGKAGAFEELVVAVASHVVGSMLHEPLQALAGGLTGWLRSRRRLSPDSSIAVEIKLRGRPPVRITQGEIDEQGVPDIVRRIEAELEAGTTGGA